MFTYVTPDSWDDITPLLVTPNPQEDTTPPHENTGPATRTCRSSPRPQSVVFWAPCNLDLSWLGQQSASYSRRWLRYTEYKPINREADLWGFLVTLEQAGFELGWGQPTKEEIAEHSAIIMAIQELQTRLEKPNMQFGRATKCCVIQVGKGNKYNTRCIHGERPFFQGSGLVHTITLRTPSHGLITIPPTTKKDAAFREIRRMKQYVSSWLRLNRTLPPKTPYTAMNPQAWDHFAHDLAWYVSQTKRLALKNRGVRWTPTPPEEPECVEALA
jgi:hypothetical protein